MCRQVKHGETGKTGETLLFTFPFLDPPKDLERIFKVHRVLQSCIRSFASPSIHCIPLRSELFQDVCIETEECRPGKKMIFSALVHGASARLDVTAEGRVNWAGGSSSSWITLSNTLFVPGKFREIGCQKGLQILLLIERIC